MPTLSDRLLEWARQGEFEANQHLQGRNDCLVRFADCLRDWLDEKFPGQLWWMGFERNFDYECYTVLLRVGMYYEIVDKDGISVYLKEMLPEWVTVGWGSSSMFSLSFGTMSYYWGNEEESTQLPHRLFTREDYGDK